jgi:hypothetical protein
VQIAARRRVLSLLTAVVLVSQPAADPGVAAAPPQAPNGSTTDPPPRDDWPKVQISDPATRDAAKRALTAASRWLAHPKCDPLFSEFQDSSGIPLQERLRQLETTPPGYLNLVFFFDGEQHPTCKRHGILAFTAVGSRTVYLCGRDFERAWTRNPREVQATIIHEMLHSLGLGENPPAPRDITDRVQKRCWQ